MAQKYSYINIPADAKPRERFEGLLNRTVRITCNFQYKMLFRTLLITQFWWKKVASKFYWILTNPCKYHVHQTWIRRVFLTPVVGSAIHQFGSCLRQQVAIMALITPLPATQVQHDIFVLPRFCLQIATHNFFSQIPQRVNLPCVHLEYTQPAKTHTSHPHAFAVVARVVPTSGNSAEQNIQSVLEVTWKQCRG